MSDSTQDIVHGVGKTTDQVELDAPKKTAPMPDLSEVNDRSLSAGSDGITHGVGSGKGGHDPKGHDEQKGFGALAGPPHLTESLAKGETDIPDRDEPQLRGGSGASGSSK